MSARAAAVRSKTHRPRRRLAVFSLAALAVTGFAVWLAPAVAVLTNLRDRPLIAAFEGIDGTVASGSAKWNWLHGIEYRDVVINDHNGKTIAHLPLVQLDRGLLHLSFDLTSLGTVRLFSPQIFIEVRSGSTTLEDLLAPWLARSSSNASIRATIEVSDGRLELVDSVRQDTWQLDGLMASASIRPELRSGGWTVSGRLEHLIQNGAAMASLASTVKPAPSVIEGNPATTRSVAVAATTAAFAGRRLVRIGSREHRRLSHYHQSSSTRIFTGCRHAFFLAAGRRRICRRATRYRSGIHIVGNSRTAAHRGISQRQSHRYF